MQHLLLVVIAILVVGLGFTVVRWPGGMHMTFSQHAAVSRWSRIYYSLLFTVTLPLLLWFFVGWFVPQNNLPDAFIWFAAVAVLFQIACTWFPEVGGRKTVAHRTLTGISGIAMLPLVVIIALSPGISALLSGAVWAGLCFMLTLLAIALTNQKGYRWALLLQVGYYAVFFMILVLVTYSSHM